MGWATTPANKSKSPGIQAVAARLAKAGDGRPRLFLMRDSLDERDPDLADRKLPTCLEEEMDGYIWDTKGGKKVGEEPLKKDDHSCDALRYMVYSFDGDPTDTSGKVTVIRT